MAVPDRRYKEPRRFGAMNWRGLWTLYVKEVRRFVKVYTQTLLAPVITSLLFLAIFSLALGRAVEDIAGVPFLVFLTPGLIMMMIAQNGFANTSSSILIAKIQGNIVDVLMPPIGPSELMIAYVFSGLTRGVVVGAVTLAAMSFFVPVTLHHPVAILFFTVAASLMMSMLGVIAGLWAEKFDHIAAITNFIVTPLSFLSGTFYSIDRLPELFRTLALFNPLFYMIDGFRYGFIDRADAPLWLGAAVLIGVNVALWLLTQRLLASGYKLKA
jgi:ABC-2 type transport system permease protein